jgi:hypothetical protein
MINEGGYIKSQEGFFNQSASTVLVKDYKTEMKNFCYPKKHSRHFYRRSTILRNYPNIDKINPGSLLSLICLLMMKPQNLS